MSETIQPSNSPGKPGPIKPERSGDGGGDGDGKKLSFKDLLNKARKAFNQGEKTSEVLESVSATDRAELEKALSQNQQLENLFEELFEMIEQMKERKSDFDETSFMEGEAE